MSLRLWIIYRAIPLAFNFNLTFSILPRMAVFGAAFLRSVPFPCREIVQSPQRREEAFNASLPNAAPSGMPAAVKELAQSAC